jgi:hypothetical protein
MSGSKRPGQARWGCKLRGANSTFCTHDGCRQCELGFHCGNHNEGCHQNCGPLKGHQPKETSHADTS